MAQPSIAERISYGFGNFGANLAFGMAGAYLLYFYTDVYRVSAGIVATLFLVARCLDAVFDPLFGLLIDRTQTRFGKHRPYLIGLCVPYALCGVALFSTPHVSALFKIAFLYGTYTLFGMLYSGLSLPLNSMLPTLTRDGKTRTSINALREFLGSSATVGATFITLPLVHWFGGSLAGGFAATAALFGIVSIIALTTAFFKTRERVGPERSPQVLTTRQSLRAARGNWPWVATMLVNFFFWVGFIGHIQSVIYYADDVLHRADLVPEIMLTNVVLLIGTALSAFVANRIGKRTTGMIGAAIAAACTAAIPMSNLRFWVLSMNGACNFGLGLIGGLLFAFMADSVDYGEWRSGFRAQGFLFAAASFGVKLGMSIGGAAGAWLLSRAHYVAGVPVTPPIAVSIVWGHIWIPTASYFLMGLSLSLFRFPGRYGTSGAGATG